MKRKKKVGINFYSCKLLSTLNNSEIWESKSVLTFLTDIWPPLKSHNQSSWNPYKTEEERRNGQILQPAKNGQHLCEGTWEIHIENKVKIQYRSYFFVTATQIDYFNNLQYLAKCTKNDWKQQKSIFARQTDNTEIEERIVRMVPDLFTESRWPPKCSCNCNKFTLEK